MSIRVVIVQRPDALAPLSPSVARLGTLGALQILGAPNTPILARDGLILLGWAFHRDSLVPLKQLDDGAAGRIKEEGHAWVYRHLWGNFFLVWHDRYGVPRLLRSPPAGQAIYYEAGRGAQSEPGDIIAFTDLGLARALGLRPLRPDPAALDSHIRFPLMRGPHTGIAGVRELLPGEAVDLQTRTLLPGAWTPWSRIPGSPRRILPEELRACVEGVVGSWADCFGQIQLELSGGLDSSIVAACLQNRTAPWRAVNLATPGIPGDEREYARASAAHAGTSLAEIVMPDEEADPLAPIPIPRARPGGFGLLGSSDEALLAAAQDFGADAIFTGVGGDNVFGYIRKAGPVADALRFAGFGAAWRAASDLATMTGDSVWRALRLALLQLVRAPRLWPHDPTLLTTRYDRDSPQHPWLTIPPGIAPGQFGYGRALMPIQLFVDGYDRSFAMPMIAPLLSQPIVELGLQGASWDWCAGGHDRALARAAFADRLAPMVRDRRTKGRVESLFVTTYNRRRGSIREFLLEGYLASAGIIDRDAVDAALKPPADALDAVYIRLLQIADVERWIRSL
jgi:asparagine synthase (glutamine-hydrolysing)